MYEIHIDTSQRKYNKVALVKDGEIIDNVEGEVDLAGTVEGMLKKYNLKPVDIDKVVPNLGPGSYTGLRVGITFANIFNWANGLITIKDQKLPEYGEEPNITPPKSPK